MKKYPFFVILNLLIILIAEWRRDYFDETGFIHLIAIVFSFFVIYFIFKKYFFCDQYFRSFLKTMLISLGFLALLHIFEYTILTLEFAGIPDYKVDFLVSCGYLSIVSLVTLAILHLLNSWRKKSMWVSHLYVGLLSLVGASAIYLLATPQTEEQMKVASAVLLAGITLTSVALQFWIVHLKKSMPVVAGFGAYLQWTMVFMLLAAVFEFSEIVNFTGLPSVQNTFTAHFFVYFALSSFLLGFDQLTQPKGIYKDVELHSL